MFNKYFKNKIRFFGKGRKSWIAVGSEDLRASGRGVLAGFGKQRPEMGSPRFDSSYWGNIFFRILIYWLGTTWGYN
jgi:hypothetical protein